MEVIDLRDGVSTLAHFNDFHDGFIKSLEILSADDFVELGVQDLTGNLAVRIVFAHHNYPNAVLAIQQRVVAKFSDACEIHVDFSGRRIDWPITTTAISEAQREGDYGLEQCLRFEVRQRRGGEESLVILSFTFKHAIFEASA